ncbi:2 3-bisphosphoglycerate-independent phosphoglycerate mutase [Clostridium sp. CAG:609]|nr:2 3-bisphosphoglycerate-independent phosphoglycerate mutase [Clostridium sp. CAG:609]
MKKILTIILDGFGYREEEKGNAILAAHMKTFTELWNKYPHALLEASEEAVGLSKGQAGNSEVGHMTIGAGRLLKQSEMLVNDFLKEPDMENANVIKLLENKDKDIHIMGLCSDGNIHAGVDDFLSMYKFLIDNGFTKIHFHLITDGRDTGVHDAMKYINMIKDIIIEYGVGDVVSICGRYYAMDRDENWDRTKAYYDLVVGGKGLSSINIEKSINSSYEKGITDEFIKPIICSKNTIKNGDIIMWMNYRADRAKQILSSIVNWSTFDGFSTENMKDTLVFSFLPVDKKIKTYNLIEPVVVKNSLGLYLSELDFTQARIAESEKFPHVTYFFDGGVDGKIKGCDKFHIPSPSVATYDLKPEMSCVEVTKRVILSMNNDYDFILVNFANPDMVGHTGNMDAATKACMAVDMCLNKIMEKAEDNFYKVVILADHGNADIMINDDGSICTTHTTSVIPFILCDEKVKLQKTGSLVNVAPTILDYMDIAIPKEMEGTESLIVE